MDEDDDDDDTSLVMRKVRNIIRSLLSTSQKKVPVVASFVKGLLGCMEMVTGIRLLPKEIDNTRKRKSKSKNSKKKEVTSITTSSSNSSNTSNISSSRKSQDSDEGMSKSKSKAKYKAKAKQQSKPKSSTIPTESSSSKKKQTSHAHLNQDLKTSNPNYRIQRELKQFLTSPPPNLSLKVGKNIRIWIISMVGTPGSLYEGETYRLRVQFPVGYPTEPPSVYFLEPTPRHEHVYTNGDICLSLLGKDWRPNMTAQSIAMSILSILGGAGRKSLPMDNAAHAQSKPGQKQDDWVYHDDNC